MGPKGSQAEKVTPVAKSPQRGSTAGNAVLVIASCLVPGLGFIVKRDYWRGITIFLVLNGTFALGLLMNGTVLIPEFNYRSQSFNIVNLLSFIGQMGNSGASIICMGRDNWEWELPEENVETRRPMRRKLKKILHKVGAFLRRVLPPAREKDALFDLAALYLLVSGCMNYFCVCNFYDRHVGRTAEEAES